jgi:hypothetical protein
MIKIELPKTERVTITSKIGVLDLEVFHNEFGSLDVISRRKKCQQ